MNRKRDIDMSDHVEIDNKEIFARVLRAGRRTYFFDVRATQADEYFLTITESKKYTNNDGSYFYKKHKIYLYKEDFAVFTELLKESTDFILKEKGEEVISERHQSHFNKDQITEESVQKEPSAAAFTNIDFEDI